MPFKFFIQDLYDRTEVLEPRGWKDIQSVLKRDFPTHGMFFKYTDGAIKLGFVCDGVTLLEAAYVKDGAEAFYQFEVEEADSDVSPFVVIFSGELDFETRFFDENYFEAEVNEIDDLVKIKNRSSTKINLNKNLTLDGTTISNINFDSSIISLATKEFKQLVVKNNGETLDSVQSDAETTQTFLFGNIGFLTIESNELKRQSSVTTELSTSANFGSFLIVEDNGALELNFDIDVDINLTEDQGSSSTTYGATLLLVFDKPVKSNTGALFTSVAIDTDSDTSASPNNVTLNLTINTNKFAIVTPGTKCSIELTLTMTTTGTAQFSAVLDITKFDLTITDKIGIPGTQSQWYHLHDALNKNLNFITNEYDFLFSEMLGDIERGYVVNGCFHNMRIINGFRVRQINDSDKTMQFSFKKFISNIDVINAVGYGIEELESPTGLGVFTITTEAITVYDELTITIPGDLTSDFQVGDNLGFFDNEFLYGTWPVLSISYSAYFDETEIVLNVSGNTNLDLVGVQTTTAFITSDKTTSLRNRLRVEEWEHFYGENELIDLGVVQDYSEEVFDEVLYNELEFGFRKFSNDEDRPTTLEEIHTNSSWSIPIKKSKKTLSNVMDWIGSTFLFNESRQNIFSRKPTTSNLHDNDIFFCDKADKIGTFTVDFSTSPDFITMPADAFENIISGSNSFSISNANNPSNDGIHDIDTSKDIVFQISTDEYLVSVLSTLVNDTNDEVLIEFSGTSTLFKPESNDKLSNSSGITRPTYFMNQRRTLKRFLIRWGTFIKSTLAYLADGNILTISNLSFDNNGTFSSQIDTAQVTGDCLQGDSSGDLIREDAIINTESFGNIKFRPNLIKGTVKICDEDFDLIKDAHKNALVEKHGVFEGGSTGEFLQSNADIDFIHQTGIFNLKIKTSFTNNADTGDVDILFVSTNFVAPGIFVFYENSVTPREGEISVSIEGDSLDTIVTTDLRSIFNDENVHEIEIIGDGSDITIKVDGVDKTTGATGINPGGASANPLFVGAQSLTDAFKHKGNIAYIRIENNNSIQVINWNFNNGDDIDIRNSALNKIVNSSLTWGQSPSGPGANYDIIGVLDTNYGYFTVTSPRAKVVTGWLMEIKRNPVDRIAKIQLLERFGPSGASGDGLLLETGDFVLSETGGFILLE